MHSEYYIVLGVHCDRAVSLAKEPHLVTKNRRWHPAVIRPFRPHPEGCSTPNLRDRSQDKSSWQPAGCQIKIPKRLPFGASWAPSVFVTFVSFLVFLRAKSSSGDAWSRCGPQQQLALKAAHAPQARGLEFFGRKARQTALARSQNATDSRQSAVRFSATLQRQSGGRGRQTTESRQLLSCQIPTTEPCMLPLSVSSSRSAAAWLAGRRAGPQHTANDCKALQCGGQPYPVGRKARQQQCQRALLRRRWSSDCARSALL